MIFVTHAYVVCISKIKFFQNDIVRSFPSDQEESHSNKN